VNACVAVPMGNNKLQENLVTDQEVKEDEIKRTKRYKREGEEGESRKSHLGSDCRVAK
jgi:hypothetical protein